MAARKTSKVVEDMIAVADGAVEAVKTTTKKATKKVGEVKAAAEEKAAETKAKRTTRKAINVSFNVEFQGIQRDITDVAKRAEKAFRENHKDVVIETLAVYCKPEEGVAYYAVNGEGLPEYKIEL